MLIQLIFGLAGLAAVFIGVRAIITRQIEYIWTDSDLPRVDQVESTVHGLPAVLLGCSAVVTGIVFIKKFVTDAL